jgi:hypothetical protein
LKLPVSLSFLRNKREKTTSIVVQNGIFMVSSLTPACASFGANAVLVPTGGTQIDGQVFMEEGRAGSQFRWLNVLEKSANDRTLLKLRRP